MDSKRKTFACIESQCIWCRKELTKSDELRLTLDSSDLLTRMIRPGFVWCGYECVLATFLQCKSDCSNEVKVYIRQRVQTLSNQTMPLVPTPEYVDMDTAYTRAILGSTTTSSSSSFDSNNKKRTR